MDNYPSIGQGIARTVGGSLSDQASPARSPGPAPAPPGFINQLADSQSKLLSRLIDVADRTEHVAAKLFGPVPEAGQDVKVAQTNDGIAYLSQQHIWQHAHIDRIYAALERLERL